MVQDTSQPEEDDRMPPAASESLRLDAREALDTARWAGGQFITTATVLSSVTVVVWGFAAKESQAAYMLVGAVITSILLMAFWYITRSILPFMVAVSELDDGLILLPHVDIEKLAELDDIRTISDKNQRKQALHQLEKVVFWHSSFRFATLLFIFAIVSQIIAVPVLVYGFGWKLL